MLAGLHLNDRLLSDAARQRIRHLDTLVAAPDGLMLQQQQSQPSGIAQLSPLYRIAVAGGADEVTAEVCQLQMRGPGAGQGVCLCAVALRQYTLVSPGALQSGACSLLSPCFSPWYLPCVHTWRSDTHT